MSSIITSIPTSTILTHTTNSNNTNKLSMIAVAGLVFIAGCISTYYTGKTTIKKYDTSGNIIEEESTFNYSRGTGLGWATLVVLHII
jgi:hypothetical protein